MITWIFIIQVNDAKNNRLSTSLNPTLFDTISNPVVFVVGYTGSYVPKTTTSLTKNGTFIETGIDQTVHDSIVETFPNSIFLSVVTDDEAVMGFDIDTWINNQCKIWRGEKNRDHKCFILTEYSQYKYSILQYTSSVEELKLKIKHRKRHPITRSSLEYQLLKALQTKAPSTMSPAISGTCEERFNPLDCIGNCRYFGVEYKCRPVNFCDFKIHSACKSNPKYCRFNAHTNKCTWK